MNGEASGLQIRAGRDDDADGYIALIGDCWREYPGVVVEVEAEVPEIRTLATFMADHGGALWTAERSGRVVGMTASYPGDDGWVLSRVYLDATQRGTGVGQSLLRLAEDHARAAGAARMSLWSDVLFTRAHSFYEKHGYVRRGGLRALNDLSNTIEAGFTKPLAGLVVEELDMAAAESAERALSTILRDCVQEGASIGFLLPLAREPAMAFWRRVTKAVGQGETRLFAAWWDGELAGTVQLGLDMPQNQPHRGDIKKLLVSPAIRRRGIARVLMRAAEAAAVQAGRRLLVLDTLAEAPSATLYRNLGWSPAGVIPGYALDETGQAHGTEIFYKAL
ncbi:GNAT family N-acetyltransferase [Acidisphaera sp. L21]|uniref:GNAT family N-acetyltransferase n=1 Tax=Acidisphaera sp. L21 TaxID=1641851 RepID=UPI00131E1D81|nr:GNAT family N-acetyltransferase [Acidisphaera sp. L21]